MYRAAYILQVSICMSVIINTYTHVYIYSNCIQNVYLYIYMYNAICIYRCIHVDVGCMRRRTYVYIYIHIHVTVPAHVYIHIYVYIHMFESMYKHCVLMSVYESMHVGKCVYIYIYTCVEIK